MYMVGDVRHDVAAHGACNVTMSGTRTPYGPHLHVDHHALAG